MYRLRFVQHVSANAYSEECFVSMLYACIGEFRNSGFSHIALTHIRLTFQRRTCGRWDRSLYGVNQSFTESKLVRLLLSATYALVYYLGASPEPTLSEPRIELHTKGVLRPCLQMLGEGERDRCWRTR